MTWWVGFEAGEKKGRKTGPSHGKTDYWQLESITRMCGLPPMATINGSHLMSTQSWELPEKRRLFHITNIVHWYKSDRPLQLQEMSQIGTVTW